MDWFKSLGLDMYLNIIKYMKITGRDILEGDETFLVNVMGMLSDHMKKVKYEMNSVKNSKCSKIKLWGWGSNKQGQLGQMDFTSFIKAPVSIPLPEMKNEFDFIMNVYCGLNYTFFITRYGELYITGNYNSKDLEQLFASQKISLNNSNLNTENKKNKSRKTSISSNNSNSAPVKTHLWSNLTKEICFDIFSNEGNWK